MTSPDGSACGCRQCGGPTLRADTLTARRVLAYAPYIAHMRHAAPGELASRHYPPSLYSRLVMARGGSPE